MTGPSSAFLDLGYTEPSEPRPSRARRASAVPVPVHHETAPGDRSPAAAALRAMRTAIDAKRGFLPSDQGVRAGDDPFARAQLAVAYERLRAALALYNTFAADLDVPGARAFIGDVEVREGGQ
ncbi:hypothetical protein BLA13014_00410 [Burkholderia aenigmatica]|uniref:Uncharacterized protein n=2 Tax=Burkholderia cepacia complex TaxID=87882 RepID=A0A6P2HEU1_9BURK|nr:MULTISPECIES: hypothetical protein [Burkholderia]VWB15023.1 hypothetical protein BLA13014_00410 [Burkholderia aenigmatica]